MKMKNRPELLVVLLLVLTGVSSGFHVGALRAEDGSPPIDEKDVRDGRSVHYDFETLDRSGNSTYAVNRAGSRHHGLITDGVQQTPRDDGSALRFRGDRGEVSVENATSLSVQRAVTVSFWIRLAERQYSNVLGHYGSYYFFVADRRLTFVVMNESDKIAQPTLYAASNDEWVDEWVHVVGTYAPSEEARLYVNGQLVDTKAVETPPDLRSETLEINMGGWHNGTDGSIDEFSLWNRSLSEEEVRMLHQERERAVLLSPPVRSGLTLLLLLVVLLGVTVTADE